MPPEKPLPYTEDFHTADEYVDSLLRFATTSLLFQTLCGGVHILDFFTRSPSLYDLVLPKDWRSWLLDCNSMDFLDLLMRDDLDTSTQAKQPPDSLISYIKDIRRHSLCRGHTQRNLKALSRQVSSGM